MNKRGLLIILAISALLNTAELHADSIRHQLAQREAKIETLKQHGLIVEQPDGFLGTGSNDPEITELINEENIDRRANREARIEEMCREKWQQNYRMQFLCRQERSAK
ncbi:DUF1318 domain-containing protein [Desulfopila sp. IMCC35008]|uniref:DUF1318 domain-containing protein n=1 Tax=Desulfopila sp. IMCC35008 TaxID=2653858 RepID=UPI0013D4D2B8|nr:DUF1318 domain-containing protein [Desulfopila sp. IMCC35008]